MSIIVTSEITKTYTDSFHDVSVTYEITFKLTQCEGGFVSARVVRIGNMAYYIQVKVSSTL